MWTRILFQKTRATVSANSCYRGGSFRESGALGTPARRRPKCNQLHLRTCQRTRITERGCVLRYFDCLTHFYGATRARARGCRDVSGIETRRPVFYCGTTLCFLGLDSAHGHVVARQRYPFRERLPRAKKSDRAQDRSLQRFVPAIAMESGPNLAGWALSVRSLREKLSANNSAKCSPDIVFSIPLRTPIGNDLCALA